MQKYRRQLVIGVLLIIAAYVLYFFVADNQSGESLGSALAGFDGRVLPFLMATQGLMIACRFFTWQYYLGVIGARHRISVMDSFVLFVSCFVLVISPGKAAEVLKSVLLRAKTGVPFARSVPIVLAERIIDGLAVILLMSIALLVAGDTLNLGVYNGVDYSALSRVIVYSSLVVIVGGLIVVQIRPLAQAVLALIQRLPLIRRLHEPLVLFYESSRDIFNPRHVLPMTLVGTGVYAASSLCFLGVLHGFGLTITWQLVLQATFIVGVTSAIGALSFVPNGAGITEISNTGMLLAIVAPNDPQMTLAIAAAASLIQGFFHKWLRVLVGLTVAVVFRNRLFSAEAQAALADYEQSAHAVTEAVDTYPDTPVSPVGLPR